MIMENFNEAIFDDEEFLEDDLELQNPGDNQEPGEGNQEPPVNEPEDDLTSEVLRLKGTIGKSREASVAPKASVCR